MNEGQTFNDAFDALLTIQSAQSKNTYAQAKCVIDGHLRPWFGSKLLAPFQTSYEEEWAMYRSENAGVLTRRGKPRRFAHDRRYLVMTLKRAQIRGWTSKTFTKRDFTLKEAHEPIGRALSDEEQKRLLTALESHPRTHLQARMAMRMAMRLSEILKLRVEEVNLEKRTIILDPNRLKTRQARKVPIPISNTVYDDLAKYVLDAKGIYVFPMDRNADEPQADNRHWWTRARRASGVQCRFHDLRHTAITAFVSGGMATEWISQVCGATPQVLGRVYSHLREDDMEKFRQFWDGKEKKNERTEIRRDNSAGLRAGVSRIRRSLLGVFAA